MLNSSEHEMIMLINIKMPTIEFEMPTTFESLKARQLFFYVLVKI